MGTQPKGGPVVVRPGGGQALPRIPLSIRVSGAESGGSLEVYESRDPDGPAAAPPPPHIHREHEELFYILDGRFTFVLGQDTTTVEAGSLVFVPRGTRHGFTPDPGARLLVVTIPAGLEGFFRELGEGLAAGKSNVEIRAALQGRFDSYPQPEAESPRRE
jgi:mannose-6-phosphate isomerase-like protein (cupin superfamily)